MNSKIQKELPELVKNKVITQEIASSIEVYYLTKKEDSPNRLFTVFAVLGSTLVGLGIILILAHNWDNFSRSVKTIFAFIPLIIGQFSVGYTILKKKSVTWREASGVFLFFAVGASMALVSQIYNIPEDFDAYTLTWILLCTPLIYLLKSQALAMLHTIFATSYACSVGYFSGNESPWLYLILFALIIPHYVQLLRYKSLHNVTSIFNWFLPLSFIIVLGAFVKNNVEFGVLMYVILFGLFYNIGKLPFFDSQKLRRNGYLVLGSLGTVYMLLLTSFEWIWKDVFTNDMVLNSQEFYMVIVLFLVTLGVIAFSYVKKWIEKFNMFQYVFVLFALFFFIGLVNSIVPILLINVLILTLGITVIKIGADKFHFGILNYGLLIIAALITCRFFDTDVSFVIRGLLFVGVGIGFFSANYIMLKKQRKKAIK